MAFWIVTDIGCDLPLTYIEKQEKLTVLPMPYQLDGVPGLNKPGDEETSKEFYDKLRQGSVSTTSQVNVDTYFTTFKELLTKGEEVLCLTLSGGISGSVRSAFTALEMLREEMPLAKVRVVDTLCASLGQGLMVDCVIQQRAQGKSLEECAKWAEDNRQKIIHWFTVDDLNFLFRGGRVSRTSAVMGSMLRIKPVMHVNEEGKLVLKEKVQGRKMALKTMADKMLEFAVPKEGQKVFISHGDCEDEAEYVANFVKESRPGTQVFISPMGRLIGSHSGPGTMAIFFLGEQR